MKRSGRVFIFGAGVSKAIAGAPVMQELYSRMKKRYEDEKKRKDCPWGNNRIVLFEKIQGFIDMLDIQGKRPLSGVLKDPDRKVNTPIHEDIEYLVTLLDLHTSYSPLFRFEQPGVDIAPYPFNPLPYTNPREMKEVRVALATYLYLCLSGLGDQKGLFRKFFIEHLDGPDQLITFNYDLLIENTLWKLRRWSPVGGYFGITKLEYQGDEEDLTKYGRGSSLHKILKLHGSINWEPQFLGSGYDPVISLDNQEKWGFFFDKLQHILRRKPKEPSGREEARISKGYAGAHFPTWLLPSFFKGFDEFPSLLEIWREAQRILASARNLIVAGYSFNRGDQQSQLLFGSVPYDCRILIVDPDADEVKARMSRILQLPNIMSLNKPFEEWVEEGCPELEIGENV